MIYFQRRVYILVVLNNPLTIRISTNVPVEFECKKRHVILTTRGNEEEAGNARKKRKPWSVVGLTPIAKIELSRGHSPNQVDGRRLPALESINSHE